MDVQVFENADQLALKAATIVKSAILLNKQFVLGLAAGRTPAAMYRVLVEMYEREELGFSQITTFNLDEYCDEPEYFYRSFQRQMQDDFLNSVDVYDSNSHFPSSQFPEAYDDLIRSKGGIDLQILGLGMNGHIAFNEPGSSFNSRTRLTSLSENTLDENFGPESQDHIPRSAVTMGIGTILEAKRILLLVTGGKKAKVVQALIEGPHTEDFPASALQSHPNVTVLIDNAAGSCLT